MFYGTATWTFNNGEVAEAPYANRWIIEGADTDSPRIVLFQAFAVSRKTYRSTTVADLVLNVQDMSDLEAAAKRQQTE